MTLCCMQLLSKCDLRCPCQNAQKYYFWIGMLRNLLSDGKQDFPRYFIRISFCADLPSPIFPKLISCHHNHHHHRSKMQHICHIFSSHSHSANNNICNTMFCNIYKNVIYLSNFLLTHSARDTISNKSMSNVLLFEK